MKTYRINYDLLDGTKLIPITTYQEELNDLINKTRSKMFFVNYDVETNLKDEDIKNLFIINKINNQYQTNLINFEERLKELQSKLNVILKPIKNTIESFTFHYDDIEKPSKIHLVFLSIFGITLTIIIFALLGLLIQTNGFSDVIPGLIIFLLVSVTFGYFGFEKRKTYLILQKQYLTFINEELVMMINEYETKWVNIFADQVSDTLVSFNLFIEDKNYQIENYQK